MSTTQKLTRDEIQSVLASLEGWTLVGGKLHREYRFANFVKAFGFMTQAAMVAESMNHHPEWSNVYNSVKVDLMTHDVKGISRKDFDLALKMDELARASEQS